MNNNQNEHNDYTIDTSQEPNIDASFKNVFYMSVVFVGGCLLFYLFIAYSGRL